VFSKSKGLAHNVNFDETLSSRLSWPEDSAFSHPRHCLKRGIRYRAELATRLQKLGYEIERGKDGQPEIKGYTREYLEASSPRRQQVQDYKREQGIDGAAAGQIAAHRTRDRKELLSPEEVQRQHRELAE